MNDITKSAKWDFLERPSVAALDAQLGKPHPVLDHGFIRIIDYMGDEPAIVQAARVSYGKGTKSPSDDRGLIRYLMRHRHTTPLEMCEIKLHVKLPVFVARQWIRHRTANVNEYSARYSILANEFYIPEPDDIQPQSTTNKQGRDGQLPEEVRQAMRSTIEMHGANSYQIYDELRTAWPWLDADGNIVEAQEDLDDHGKDNGMARELARMVLPPNVYTEWYWKVDLHNLLHFLSLRADPHAQREIRVYAEVMCRMVADWLPNVWEAFQDYTVKACHFSGIEMDILRELLADQIDLGIPIAQGMSIREHTEFERKLGVDNEER